jgi:DNA-binding MarR family transcriptional regulator
MINHEKPQEDDKHLAAWRAFITAHALIIERIDHDLAQAKKIPLHWYDVLIELYEAPEKRLRLHEIAQRVVLSRSGLTRLVDRLEQSGYLQRQSDPDDRRGYYAVITAEGVQALREAWQVYGKGVQQYFAAHLSAEQSDQLVALFSGMVAQLRDQAG